MFFGQLVSSVMGVVGPTAGIASVVSQAVKFASSELDSVPTETITAKFKEGNAAGQDVTSHTVQNTPNHSKGSSQEIG